MENESILIRRGLLFLLEEAVLDLLLPIHCALEQPQGISISSFLYVLNNLYRLLREILKDIGDKNPPGVNECTALFLLH